MNLQLSLKTKWFEMTDPNGKTEDYRLPTSYFYNKFCLYKGEIKSKKWWEEFLKTADANILLDFMTFKPFTHNIMTLGYPSKNDTSRIKVFEHLGIEIGYGKQEWGAEPNKLYFIIKHGKQIN